MKQMLSSPDPDLSQIRQEGMGPLIKALSEGRIERVLFCHINDRWYLGELFCHAAWIESLAEAGLRISVCTKDSFLELFSNHPAIDILLPCEAGKQARFTAYPLVVFTSTHPPKTFTDNVEHSIYSWNKGLAYVHRGQVKQRLDKSAINHFRSSRPHHKQLPLATSHYLRLHLGEDELAEGGRWLDRLGLDKKRNAIVLNPSASNSITRRSERPKAVDNLLLVEDYASLIRALQNRFPDDAILVGSPVLATDDSNHRLVQNLCDIAASPGSVIPLTSNAAWSHGIGFRAFAALLANSRVRGMIGNSTGTNAHLAATISLPALSIERAVDDNVRSNWAQPDRGQMGSVAWRNPESRMAAYALSWQSCNDQDFDHIAEAFRLHLNAVEERWEVLFDQPSRAVNLAKTCLDGVPFNGRLDAAGWLLTLMQFRDALRGQDAVDFYFDLSEETAFLQVNGKVEAAALVASINGLRTSKTETAEHMLESPPPEDMALFQELLADSNLFKLLKALAVSKAPCVQMVA